MNGLRAPPIRCWLGSHVFVQRYATIFVVVLFVAKGFDGV